MKRATSISLVLLIIASVMNLSVAVHYCGGKIAASKISLTGKLAGCGMEVPENGLPVSGTYFTKHCCEDVVTSCLIYSSYIPTISFDQADLQNNFQISAINTLPSPFLRTEVFSLFTEVNPPGVLRSTNVDLSDICVFRI